MLCEYKELKKLIQIDFDVLYKELNCESNKITQLILENYKKDNNFTIVDEFIITMFLTEIYINEDIDINTNLYKFITRENLYKIKCELKDDYIEFESNLIDNVELYSNLILNNIDFYIYKRQVILDVNNLATIEELFEILKFKLNLSCNVINWEMFWECISLPIIMPEILEIKGWNHLQKKFPDDAKEMKKIFIKLKNTFSNMNFKVIYS